ncbi:MAG: GTPase ObgE, partial [Candidatus Omnitrophica bacterium]|nr:GTPase ObgE [Candidatus Omnitrophota bacterium]
GKGLGHDFLRHIERTRILIHMVDMSSLEGRDAYKDYSNLNNELILYNPKLGEKIQILVANKMDIPGAKENIKKFRRSFKDKIYPVSALNGEGIEQLLEAIGRALD